jgi:hypothetical protein
VAEHDVWELNYLEDRPGGPRRSKEGVRRPCCGLLVPPVRPGGGRLEMQSIVFWSASHRHYRNRGLCREPDPLGTGLYALGTACAERELSAERSRHRWAGIGGSAESHGPNSRHSCAESPLSSRHRPVHN